MTVSDQSLVLLTQSLFSCYTRFHIDLDPVFNWNGRYWIWIEDNNNNQIYHNEYILFKQQNFKVHIMEVYKSPHDPESLAT